MTAPSMSDISNTKLSNCAGDIEYGAIGCLNIIREEIMTMNLKLTNSEAVAVMTSLQHYLKEVEKMDEEKGVLIEKQTLKGLISKMESMPAGEVQ